MDNPQVNAYLDRVSASLRTLPAEQRDEELRELRQHLELLIEAQRALGLGEKEAIDTALRQFGQAEQIGRQLQQAEKNAHQGRLWQMLLFYACSVVLIFGLLATANDKPTDFPATIVGQLAFAFLLPLGTLMAGVLYHFRTRQPKMQE